MNEHAFFSGRVGLQQRVLPRYRAEFFDHLADLCRGGLSVFVGLPRPKESIATIDHLERAGLVLGKNMHLLGGPLYLCYQIGLMRWLQTWDPEVLILEANPRYLSNYGAIRWMHRRGRSVIGWGLGSAPASDLFTRMRAWARGSYLSGFEALIAYGSLAAEQYAMSGVPPERIHVAINAVTLPPARLPDREPIEGRATRVLFVGRLQRRKRVDLLLRACAQMRLKPDVWIVGDGPELHVLQRMATEIHPQTHFFGPKHGAELERLFEQADLFVLPGTGGLAAQQAMAHGLPVIVAEGDGTQRDLVSAENGWLVEGEDLQALKSALEEALSDMKRLRQMGEASYRLVLERVNIHCMGQAFVRALNGVSGSVLRK